MRTRGIMISLLLLLTVSAVGLSACSKMPVLSSPTDAEAAKAIEDALRMTPVTRISPIQIISRGEHQQDGSWPVKVKFTASTFVDYKYRKEFVKEAAYRISKGTDDKGNTVWKAVEQ